MAGENDLSSLGYQGNDMRELIAGSVQLTDKQRLLVFIDSLSGGVRKPRIVELHGGKSYPVKQYAEDFYSCDPARFHDVLQTMVEYAEAESYGLVLWGHATGWLVTRDSVAEQSRRSYGLDYGTDGNLGGKKWMNITQMARVLQDLPHFDYIFADCCNMMCVEVGYELRHATDYLIGSPAEIPAAGAPYQKIMPYLFQKDEALYRGLIDTYYDYYINCYRYDPDLKGYSIPLSVIDTRQLEPLLQATHDILPSFMPQYPQTLDFTGLGMTYYLYYDAPVMYDMRSFMKTFVSAENFLQWDMAYLRAVPYCRMSMRWMTIYDYLDASFGSFTQPLSWHGCVSMFVPRNIYSYSRSAFLYNKNCSRFEWHRSLNWKRFGWAE